MPVSDLKDGQRSDIWPDKLSQLGKASQILARQLPASVSMGKPGEMLQVVVVGGSIGGISCALALLKLGCNVTVLEKASSITAAGAVSAAVEWRLRQSLWKHVFDLSSMLSGHWPG